MKAQMLLLFKSIEFRLSLLVSTLYAIGVAIYSILENEYAYDPNAMYMGNWYSLGWGMYYYIFQFLVVFVFAESYLIDVKNGMRELWIEKVGRKEYFFYKNVAVFSGNFIVVAVPFWVNLILCNIFISPSGNTPLGEMTSANFINSMYGTNQGYRTRVPEMPLVHVYEQSPFLYNVIFLVALAIVAGILGQVILAISYFVNSRILLFLPLFCIFYLMKTVTTINFYRAVDNVGNLFINYELMDYLSPFSFPGKDYVIFMLYMVGALTFILISNIYMCKRGIK